MYLTTFRRSVPLTTSTTTVAINRTDEESTRTTNMITTDLMTIRTAWGKATCSVYAAQATMAVVLAAHHSLSTLHRAIQMDAHVARHVARLCLLRTSSNSRHGARGSAQLFGARLTRATSRLSLHVVWRPGPPTPNRRLQQPHPWQARVRLLGGGRQRLLLSWHKRMRRLSFCSAR